MTDFKYYIFKINSDKRVCSIENIPRKIPKSYMLSEGVKIGDLYPSEVTLDIFPKSGDILTDFVDNIDRCVIISSKVKTVFEEQGFDEEKIEYLPFVLHDKKGRPVKEQYHIANLLIKVHCFDYDKAKYTRSTRTGDLLNVEIIELVEDKIPEDATLFRIGEYPSRVVIRSDFLELLRKKGFTGISVVGTGNYLI